MDAAAVATRIKTTNFLASSANTGRMASVRNLVKPACQTGMAFHQNRNPCSSCLQPLFCISFPSPQRGPFPNSRNNTPFLTRCSTKPGIGSNNATNRNPAIEVGSSSTTQPLAAPTPNQALAPTSSRGLVLDLGLQCSWDSAEVGSPIVKRYIGDNEERWYMWYHGRSDENNVSDSIGLAVSSNGIHWARGAGHIRSCADAGIVMNCSNNWWAFDTESVRPSEMVIMSSPMYSAVYWLYYTGVSSEGVDISGAANISLQNPERAHPEGKVFKSLPGLACSQDGRHWARIEGDHHSGALLDVGSENEWDSLFIAAAHVVVHSSDDLRMYYHSFDQENGHFAIGLARSRDGIRWVKLGKIMGGGSTGSFDELGVKNPCVVRKQKEGNYLMSYEGVAADGRRTIGLAVSSDGLKNWNKLQNPILQPSSGDSWDCKGVGSPCLVQMEGNVDEWRLYYEGVGHGGMTGIGMAISDGKNVGTFNRWEGIQL